MSAPLVEQIANAVLYEGYLLYPYRSSAVKNQQRWNFGVVYPEAYGEAQGDPGGSQMQTQCLVAGGPLTEISVRVRFLRLLERAVGHLPLPLAGLPAGCEPEFIPSPAIEINQRTYESRKEASECEMAMPAFHCAELAAGQVRRRVDFEPTRTVEPIRDSSGLIAALIVRSTERLDCSVEMTIEEPLDGLFRLGVRIVNHTPLDHPPLKREDVLGRSLLSAHTILGVRRGEFVSLLDPPAEFQQAAAECRNLGTWPVLVGETGQRDTLLSSPIILYDYPQVAPESPGDFFDAAEIDEILSLRILTLADEEKQAMRRGDERARQILERVENLAPEDFMKLHGVLRGRHLPEEGAS
ncbi:MAG TPA: hypothetical protein VML19_33100 [Verrucomicrobiae bacterium]|nr:hypothetical protein [Verrucomicrobiae bacterium]